MCNNWDAICRRAGGRRHYNSVRTLRAELRRGQVVALLKTEGMGHGVQIRIAYCLKVSPATVSRDIAILLSDWRAAPTSY